MNEMRVRHDEITIHKAIQSKQVLIKHRFHVKTLSHLVMVTRHCSWMFTDRIDLHGPPPLPVTPRGPLYGLCRVIWVRNGLPYEVNHT